MRARGSGGCDEDENDDDDGGGGATYCPRIHSLFQFKLKPQKKRRALTRRRERAHAHGPREGWALSAGSTPTSLSSPAGLSLVFVHVVRENPPILSDRKYHRHKHR